MLRAARPHILEGLCHTDALLFFQMKFRTAVMQAIDVLLGMQIISKHWDNKRSTGSIFILMVAVLFIRKNLIPTHSLGDFVTLDYTGT